MSEMIHYILFGAVFTIFALLALASRSYILSLFYLSLGVFFLYHLL